MLNEQINENYDDNNVEIEIIYEVLENIGVKEK